MLLIDKHIARMMIEGTDPKAPEHLGNPLALHQINEARIVRRDRGSDRRSFQLVYEVENDGVILRVIGSVHPASWYSDKRPDLHSSVRVEIDVPGSKPRKWNDDTLICWHDSMYSTYLRDDSENADRALKLTVENMHKALDYQRVSWAVESARELARTSTRSWFRRNMKD